MAKSLIQFFKLQIEKQKRFIPSPPTNFNEKNGLTECDICPFMQLRIKHCILRNVTFMTIKIRAQ